MLNGDSVFTGGIEPALERFASTETDLVLLCEEVDRDTAQTTGVIEVDEVNSRLRTDAY